MRQREIDTEIYRDGDKEREVDVDVERERDRRSKEMICREKDTQ